MFSNFFTNYSRIIRWTFFYILWIYDRILLCYSMLPIKFSRVLKIVVQYITSFTKPNVFKIWNILRVYYKIKPLLKRYFASRPRMEKCLAKPLK